MIHSDTLPVSRGIQGDQPPVAEGHISSQMPVATATATPGEVMAFADPRRERLFAAAGTSRLRHLEESPLAAACGYAASPKDPERLQQEKDLDFVKQMLMGAFDLLETKYTGWAASDGKLSRQDLNYAADDAGLAQGLRDLALQLKADPRLFNVIDADSDGTLTRAELTAYRKKLEGQLQSEPTTPTEPVTGQDQAAATGTPSSGTPSSTATQATTSPPFTPIVPSKTPGLEGAIENLGSTINSVQQQMTDLTNQLTGDSKADAKVQGQITQLNTKLQMLMNLQSSLLTMMSNVSKLWSETAMNAIRNMK